MSAETLNIVVTGLVAVIVPVSVAYIKARFDRQDKRTIETDSKIDQYHSEVNGMKSELVASSRALGHAEGRAENQAETDRKKMEDK